jgi:hypothetical protein
MDEDEQNLIMGHSSYHQRDIALPGTGHRFVYAFMLIVAGMLLISLRFFSSGKKHD